MKPIQVMKMNNMKKKTSIILIFSLMFINMGLQAQEPLTLSKALEKALENNYGIVISQSQVDIAEINNNWGTAGRYPNIGFDVNSSNSKELIENTSSNRIAGSVGLNWTIFNGFRANITKDRLEKLESLAKGNAAVVVENTIQEVILSYYNILLQKEKLTVLENLMKLSEDRYKYIQLKFDVGGTVTYDVLQAKNVFLEDKASTLNQEVAVRNAVRNFNFLIGEQPTTRWSFVEEFNSDTSDYVLADLLDKMLANNQTLQNQYTSLVLQQKETALQKSTLYPSLNLSAGIENSYSWMNTKTQGSTSSEALTPYGNVSLSFDIYSGGTRKRAIDVAKVNEEITQIEVEEIKHSLTNLLFNEFDLYNLRKTLLNVSEQSLEAAEMNLQIADEKFKSGAINSFNYRDIQIGYLNTALNRLQAIYNLIYSNTTLTRLTGGFLEEEE
ncbi:MAG TPA: TolC family protein [Bacteroidales bacterium]|nr:TolC family protein [Bacteroidales bacterium]